MIVVMLLDNLHHIIARHPVPVLDDDAPGPRHRSPRLDDNLAPGTASPRAPAHLPHLATTP